MYLDLKKFFSAEDGAVTVDWVVLCAAVVVLCVAGLENVKQGVDNLAAALEQGISTESFDNGN